MTRLVMAAVAAAALAQTASNVASLWLSAPLPVPSERRVEPRPRNLSPPLDRTALERRFGMEETPPSRPDARVRGTLVATLEDASLALLESGAQAVVVRVGDAWGPFTVDRIERRRVWLASRAGRTAIEAGETVPAEAPARIRRTPGGAFVVPRAEVERFLADPMRIATQAFFTPSASGWIVSRLSADSLLRELGVLPGDEIRSLNGRPVNKLETLFGAAQELPGARRVQIDVIRAGAPLQLEYELR
jgi:type II secretory pathway component PulC